MIRLHVEIELPGAYDIRDAAAEALAVAKRLGVIISFDFNDYTITAKPDMTVNEVAWQYLEKVQKHKVVPQKPKPTFTWTTLT